MLETVLHSTWKILDIVTVLWLLNVYTQGINRGIRLTWSNVSATFAACLWMVLPIDLSQWDEIFILKSGVLLIFWSGMVSYEPFTYGDKSSTLLRTMPKIITWFIFFLGIGRICWFLYQ